jgi:hypothetical protein
MLRSAGTKFTAEELVLMISGRRARVSGTARVGADFSLLAAAVNLARLGNLGACSTPTGWTVVGS